MSELRVYQSRIYVEGRKYLLRALVNGIADPNEEAALGWDRQVT